MVWRRSIERFAIWAGVILAAAFLPSLPLASGASYTVPRISRIDATLSASLITAETHLLCLMRSDVQGTQVQTRSMCYQSYKPDPPPQLPISDFWPAYHKLASGGYSPDSGLLLLTVIPCTEFFPGVLAVSSGIGVWLDKDGGTAFGSNVLTTDTTAPFNCAFPDAGSTQTTGPLTLTTFPEGWAHNEDALEWAPGKLFDSCSDYEELGSDQMRGGLRDPFNPYDFYDVNGDGVIDLLNDIRGVIGKWNLRPGDPGYHPAYDRGPTVGPYTWNMTAPDGIINLLTDIRGVQAQWNHDCRPAP